LVLEGTQLPALGPTRRLLFEDRARAELRQPGLFEARTGGTIRAEFNMYPVLFRNASPDDPLLGYRDLSSGVGLDRRFGPLFASLFYNFQTSFPFMYHGVVTGNLQNIMLSYVDLTANLDLRNNAIHPHQGFFWGNDLQVARNPFLSSHNTSTL